MLPGLVRVPHGAERHFGKFTLIIKLGWGGMADVYLAVDSGSRAALGSRLVVVKKLKSDLLFDSDFRAMFKDEAKLALMLRHQNIVKALETGEVDGEPFLAMEYLEGQPLDRVLVANQQTRLSRAEILCLMSGLLAGLQHAHELKDGSGRPLDVVHRDISPHNVFVTYRGAVKLVDFGIAKSRIKNQHTSTGVVKGKIEYMAPEQALCSQVDKRADVFAAGVILWELLTGKRFWGELSDVQILKTMTFGELPSLEEHLPNASPELVQICCKALAISPDHRYATAAEFRSDIEAFMAVLKEPINVEALGDKIARIGSEIRAALDHAIAQQLGEFDVRDDTPLAVEIPTTLADGTQSSKLTTPLPTASRSGATLSFGSPRDLNAVDSLGQDQPRAIDPPLSSSQSAESTDWDAGRVPVWEAPAKRSRWPAMVGVAGLVGIVSLGAVRIVGQRDATTVAASDGTPGRSVAPDPAATSNSTAASPNAQTSSATANPLFVAVSIRVNPPAVAGRVDTARLDGTPLLGLPFSAKFPKDGLAHKLTIDREGFEPYVRMLVFDRDLEIDATLVPHKPNQHHGPSRRVESTSKPAPVAPPATSQPIRPAPVDTSDPWKEKRK